MLRSVGLWRAVLKRIGADRGVIAAAWLLLVSAITLLSAGALYGDAVALGGLRQAVLAQAPADRTVTVRMSVGLGDLGATSQTVSAIVGGALADAHGEVDRVAHSDAFAAAGPAADTVEDLDSVGSYDNIAAHATLSAGRWAQAGSDPIEATVSEGAADSLQLRIGDRVKLASRRDASISPTLQIVGIWRPNPSDAYWLGNVLELTGISATSTFTTHGPFVIAADDLGRTTRTDLDVEWRGLPDIDALRPETLQSLATDVGAIRDTLGATVAVAQEFQVMTSLPTILANVGRTTLVGRTGVLLLTLEFAVLAGYAIVLVSGVLVDRRRAEIALFRARGASAGHVAAMAIGEAVILSITAAVVAPPLALGIVRVLGVIGPVASAGILPIVDIGPTSVAVAAIAGLAAVLALSIPTLTTVASPSGARAALSRQVGRTLPQRLGIDLALLVAAGIAMYQLRLYGAPITQNARGILGVDPLLVAAPALGLFAGAVLAIRIVPRLGEIAERLLVRRNGLVPAIGGRQLARRPLRYSRSALLLMLALALGTFAFAQGATWTRSQADQAAYQAVSDARVVVSDYPDLPDWAFGPAYRTIPGVSLAVPIDRSSFSSGRSVRDGDLVALDPNAASAVRHATDTGSIALDRSAAALVAARPAIAGLQLPNGVSRLSVVLDSNLTSGPDEGFGEPAAPNDRVTTVGVVLVDGDGRMISLEGGAAMAVGSGQRVEIPLTSTVGDTAFAPTPPLRIQAIELAISSSASYLALMGNLDLISVHASTSVQGNDWRRLAIDPGSAAWQWTTDQANEQEGQSTGVPRVYRPPVASPGRLTFGGGPTNLPPIYGNDNGLPATIRLDAPIAASSELPALVSDDLLQLTGSRVGDTLGINSESEHLVLRIVASTPDFSPLDPTRAFVVVDAASLAAARYDAGLGLSAAAEWWLSTAPGAEPSVLATLRQKPYSAAQVVGRSELTSTLEADPVGLGVIGALGLGAIAALVFAAIGFVVSATASAGERLGEFAVLRALGLSSRQLSTWVSLETVFLLAIGLLAGSGLGLLLAWLVLPVSTLTASGAAPVPAPVIVVPWASFVPIYALAAGLLVGTIAIVTRQVRGVGISSVLRASDE